MDQELSQPSKSEDEHDGHNLSYRFWELHTNILNSEVRSKPTTELKYGARNVARLPDSEIVGFMNRHPSNSSSHYAGSLPLTPYSQENSVLLRSSICWRTEGYSQPAHNPSFKRLMASWNGCEIRDEHIDGVDSRPTHDCDFYDPYKLLPKKR
jgi:hypothetical protein